MLKTKQIGDEGEKVAVEYLKNKGYEIVHQNWRYSRSELDIICTQNDQLVFVEVKTRAYTFYGEPSEFVSARKRSFIMAAATAYMESINYEWKFRFDVISIVMKNRVVLKLDHYEDAFWPGL